MEIDHHIFRIVVSKPMSLRTVLQIDTILLPLLRFRNTFVYFICRWAQILCLLAGEAAENLS